MRSTRYLLLKIISSGGFFPKKTKYMTRCELSAGTFAPFLALVSRATWVRAAPSQLCGPIQVREGVTRKGGVFPNVNKVGQNRNAVVVPLAGTMPSNAPRCGTCAAQSIQAQVAQ